MGFNSDPIVRNYSIRQDAEPSVPLDGMTWYNPTGGVNGNNTESYLYNGDTGSWELLNSSGPDTPLHEASGAQWRDTANGAQKVYDGGWQPIGVTDHDNLTGVSAADHHTRYADTEAVSAVVASFVSETGDFSAVQYGGNTQVSFVNTYHEAPASLQAGIVTRNSVTDEYYEASWKSWVTDANGNVTGANIHSAADSGTGVTVRWRISGVTI